MPPVVRPLTAADRPRWEPLWAAYLRFYEATIPAATTELTWTRFLDPNEPMVALGAAVPQKKTVKKAPEHNAPRIRCTVTQRTLPPLLKAPMKNPCHPRCPDCSLGDGKAMRCTQPCGKRET